MGITEALYTSAEALALPRLLARNSAYGSGEGSLPRASLITGQNSRSRNWGLQVLPLLCYIIIQRRKGEKSSHRELLHVPLLCTKAPAMLTLEHISVWAEIHSLPSLSLRSTPYQMLISVPGGKSFQSLASSVLGQAHAIFILLLV